MVICRRCGLPILARRWADERGFRGTVCGCPKIPESYRKPLIPPVLTFPAACLVWGFAAGVLVGLFGSIALRRWWG